MLKEKNYHPNDHRNGISEIVKSYFQTHSIAEHHINSFDNFILKGIKDIVSANDRITSEVDQNWYVKYLDIRVGQPEIRDGQNKHSLTPQECRLRDLTYSAPIFVDIEYTRGQEVLTQKNLLIGRMPIMLRSRNCVLNRKNCAEHFRLQECPLDPGGYFIINGSEKVILMQEQASKNRIFSFKNDEEIVCEVTCIATEKKSRLFLNFNKKNQIVVKNNVFPKEGVPVYALFKAMSGLSDCEITELILRDSKRKLELFKMLLPSIEHSIESNVTSEITALEFIGKKINLSKESTRHPASIGYDLIHNSILTHIPVINDSFYAKFFYLAFMVRRFLMAHIDPENQIDNRDFYGNKRLELAGTLIGFVFEDALKRYNMYIMNIANKYIPKVKVCQFDVTKHMTSNLITHALNNAIATGNWSIRRFRINRIGVSQVLSRLSHLACLGMLTRINSQFEKTRKTTGPRSLQSSYWGIVCPSDTPEGESCGLVKNLALMCQVSTEDDDSEIFRLCSLSNNVIPYGNFDLDRSDLDFHYLFINGVIVGFVTSLKSFTNYLRDNRRNGRIPKFTSIYTNSSHKAVYVSSDAGRLCRPYIIVNSDGTHRLKPQHIEFIRRKMLNFNDLVEMGIIEYLDMNELNDCFIALDENSIVPGQSTHIEIEVFTILGICASIVPYPHSNQSPRNTYQCAMGKQAMGLIALNQNLRNDSLLYTIQYPQFPLVQTKPMRMFNWIPAGQNPVVAVMSFSGYDLEDATILNKSSIDLGYARCFVYKNAKIELKTYSNQNCRDLLYYPKLDPSSKFKNRYFCLDSDGIASPECEISENQIMVNKQSPDVVTNQQLFMESKIRYYDNGLIYRNSNTSVIDKVTISNNDEDIMVKVSYRQMRRPVVGDKFSSRHGQKGVIGAIFSKTMLPFSSEGISPDTIMNPHGFPSRMTVGKLKEMTASKAAALKGTIHDGTIFNGTSMKECYTIMHQNHRLFSGKELLISGITGELLPDEVYIGPIYYQRLKHMVADKVHSRSLGPTTTLTRQPTEGRSRDGGLRVGEMERDCLIGHGASYALMERFMISSDIYEVEICKTCNFIVAGSFCMKCNSRENFFKVRIPYAFKLLVQELFSMGIHPAMGFNTDHI
ncbi:DNA-directed RNA polymerase III subunit RPC2-like protein [Sarcoptes scabiei]|uniref:DNA-directed RNA polymerase subunit beta n=1 Tax=Sarcoptes scabiei TaxID=52283 RepID=A0A132AF60_SARSC|nr:DNA-directed RNA polymerase III subunit RPC2-like protein [Sarcoptes scabiei]